jgi:hypothetical protein
LLLLSINAHGPITEGSWAHSAAANRTTPALGEFFTFRNDGGVSRAAIRQTGSSVTGDVSKGGPALSFTGMRSVGSLLFEIVNRNEWRAA